MTACLNSIARLSKDQDHRQLFGELVGLYLLTLAQTALLYQLLQDTFNIAVLPNEASDSKKEHQKRGGKSNETWRGKSSDDSDEQEEKHNRYHYNAPEYSSPVDSDELTNLTNRMAGISLNGRSQALRHVADSLKASTSTVSLASWTAPLDSLTHNLTQFVSPVAAAIMQHRRHAGTLFYVVLIGMVLNNWRALAHFRGGTDYVFFDSRLNATAQSRGQMNEPFSISGMGVHGLFEMQPLTELDRVAAGAYLHVLNLFPPVPIIGHLFSFSEEAYYQSADETSGAIQSFFVNWLGNPAESQRVRLNYASAHVAMSLLFVFMLTHTISRRPFGMPAIGNWTAWAAGWAFVLLLIQRIVSNFPFWAWNTFANA
jgi:hypothetical protein